MFKNICTAHLQCIFKSKECTQAQKTFTLKFSVLTSLETFNQVAALNLHTVKVFSDLRNTAGYPL